MGISNAKRYSQIRPLSPEGTLRFMEEFRLGWIWNGVYAGIAEDASGFVRAVQEEESPDTKGVGFRVGAVAYEDQVVG